MPRVLDAHTMLEHAWPYLCAVETDIQRALTNCDHRDLLPDMGGFQTLHGLLDDATLAYVRDRVSVVVTPVMQFHTKHQLEEYLGNVVKAILGQLKPVKPKAVGHLWVACSVNPGKMCYELVLAIPFSKEK